MANENPFDRTVNLAASEKLGNDPTGAIAREIREHEDANKNKSWLDKGIETVYNTEAGSLANMKAVSLRAQELEQKGDKAALAKYVPEIKQAIVDDRKAVQTQTDVNFYGGSFLKAVPLFAGAKSNLLMATSIGVNAADQIKVKDTGSEAILNGALGGAKGFALKATFDAVGAKTIFTEANMTQAGKSFTASGLEYGNVAGKGVVLGGSSRLYETAFNVNTYKDQKTGQWNISGGAEKIVATTLNPTAVALDAALFMGAHGAYKGMSSKVASALEGNSVLAKVAESRVANFTREGQVLANSGVGATFGFASGSTQEIVRQKEAGQGFDLAMILKRGGMQALTDGAAGATGSSLVQGGKVLKDFSRTARNGASPLMDNAYAGEMGGGELGGRKELAGETEANALRERTGDPIKPEAVADAVPREPQVGEHQADARPEATVEATVEATHKVVPPERTAEPLADATAPVVDAAAKPAAEAAKPAEKVEVDLGEMQIAVAEKPAGTEKLAGAEKAADADANADNGPDLGDLAVPRAAKLVADVDASATQYSRKASYEMTAEQKPVFEEGIKLIQNVFTGHSSAAEVAKFLEFGAGRGQSVKKVMEQMAKDYEQLGNRRVQKLIEVAMNAKPEQVAVAVEGAQLAKDAATPGKDPFGPEYVKLVEFVYGPGRNAHDAVRIISELTGNPAMNRLLGETYAGATGLERSVGEQKKIDWGNTPDDAKGFFRDIISHRPANAEEHIVLRKGIAAWARAFPEHVDVLHQYGAMTRYADIAAAIDATVGSDYFSRFPKSHITEDPRNNAPSPVEALKQAEATGLPKELPEAVRTAEDGRQDQSPPVDSQNQAPPAERQDQAQPVVDANKPALENRPAIEHQGGRHTVYPERLIAEFENTTGTAKQARAHLLSDHVGSMSDAQFLSWLKYLHTPVDRPGARPEQTNLAAMGMSRSAVLARPEIRDLALNPANSPLDVAAVKRFLAAPEKAASGELPQETMEHIAYRLELATESQKARNEADPAKAGQPLDYVSIMKEAIPDWYAAYLRRTYSTKNPETGQYDYAPGFNENLRLWLEVSRQANANNVFGMDGNARNSVVDRMSILDGALTARTPENAALVDRLVQLGGGDQFAVKALLSKLDPATNAPEYREMLNVLAPKVTDIKDLRVLSDAIFNGKKADQDSFKARKEGRDTARSDAQAQSNESLAQSVVARLLTPGSPEQIRVSQIVSDMIAGKIRDPRPDRDGGPPGGPGGRPGGDRGGPRQGQDRGGDRGPRQGQDRGGDRGSRQQGSFRQGGGEPVATRENNGAEARPAPVNPGPIKVAQVREAEPVRAAVPDQVAVTDQVTAVDPAQQARPAQEPRPVQEAAAGTDGGPAADAAPELSQSEKFQRRYQGRDTRQEPDADNDGDDVGRGKKKQSPRQKAGGRGQTFGSFEDLARNWKGGGED